MPRRPKLAEIAKRRLDCDEDDDAKARRAAEPEEYAARLRGHQQKSLSEPSPKIAPNDSERFQPFPVDALPEQVRGFVSAAAKAIGCDASFVALPLLVALAASIGNTRRLQLK